MKQSQVQHIFGAGAVGHLLAYIQQQAGYPCQLINRRISNQQRAICFVDQGRETHASLHYVTRPDSYIDILWLTVKAYQVEQALTQAKPWLNEHSKVLLLQNGMGHLECAQQVLADTLPAHHLYIAINTHGALLDKDTQPMTITHTGAGTLKIGNNYLQPKNEAQLDLNTMLSEQCNASWEQDIEQALWAKLGINAVINPLTALHQCRNGELVSTPGHLMEVETLISELLAFYRAIGYTQLADDFSAQCLAVIKATSTNYSSMMLDKKHGRALELDAITGYLLSTADSVRLDMQAHRSLFHRLLKN